VYELIVTVLNLVGTPSYQNAMTRSSLALDS
jgi:Tfp pilus assembly protein PilE